MSIEDFEARLGRVWARAQAGDEAAYRQALGLIAERLRGYFSRRLASMPDAVEDLVQETLLALHVRRGTHEAGEPVSNWVYGIARHKLVDLWRRRGRREALHEPMDALADHAQPASEDAALAPRDLMVLLQTLPVAQRRAISLTRIEGLSLAEASQHSGVSVAALKVQVHRGLKRLGDLARARA